MASSLMKERNYKYMAAKYSELNHFQFVLGKQLVELLGVRNGDKVLDVGCATGEITAYIADTVGQEGLSIGVDPDEHRINVATQKHCLNRKNIGFVNGDSSCNFPHHNEAYYDFVYCSSVFHWMNEQEKIAFLETAFRCLKTEGRIAIISHEKNPEIFLRIAELLPDNEVESSRSPFKLVRKWDAEAMLQQAGFEIQRSEYFEYEYTFPSSDYYLTWSCASAYVDESKIVPQKKKEFAKEFENDDGTVYLSMTMYRLIARKADTV